MHTNSCDRYKALVLQKAAIEKEMDALKDVILNEMKTEGLGSFNHEGATFSIMKRAKWVYTKHIESLEDMLSMAKEDERDKGLAQVEETETLRVQIK